jgi:hypothetical protein
LEFVIGNPRQASAAIARRQIFDMETWEKKSVKVCLGCSMDTTLSPRAVLLTMTFIIVSLISQAAIQCIKLLDA